MFWRNSNSFHLNAHQGVRTQDHQMEGPNMTEDKVVEFIRELPMDALQELSDVGLFGFAWAFAEELTQADLEQLGDRWITIVDDLEVPEGPCRSSAAFRTLVSEATLWVIDSGQLERHHYFQFARRAIEGSRIVVVQVPETLRQSWTAFLDLHARRSAQFAAQHRLNSEAA